MVGGAVRDLYLGVEPKDFDLVSDATAEEVEQLFPKTLGVGRQFGIMVVVTPEGPVEVARFRSDGAYTDGRHPTEVQFASPEEDAKRRDFTVNALFYDTEAKQLIDYVGGLADLGAKVIRCVGEPAKRFDEDALRMLRAVRFEAQLGFSLDPAIVTAIQTQATRLALVSRERVTQELDRILLSARPALGLKGLVKTGLWTEVFGAPEAGDLARFDTLGPRFRQYFSAEPPLSLFYGALQAWVPGFSAEKFVLGKETKAVLRQLPEEISRLGRYDQLEMADRKLALASSAFPQAATLLEVGGLTLVGQRDTWATAGKLDPKPLLTGKDLMAAGFAAGPKIKELLDQVRRKQLNEEIASPEEALALVGSLKS